MRLLETLRGWWRSVVGDEGDVEPTVEGTGTYDYECTVCGTGVDDPDADCPLCRSSDLVATDAPPASTSSPGGSTASPGGSTHGLDGASTGGEFSRTAPPGGRGGRQGGAASRPEFEGRQGGRQHVVAADDEAVERLRELRDGGELLERHTDRWEPHQEGFRVETPAGTRIVDSREDVVALLRATDR